MLAHVPKMTWLLREWVWLISHPLIAIWSSLTLINSLEVSEALEWGRGTVFLADMQFWAPDHQDQAAHQVVSMAKGILHCVALYSQPHAALGIQSSFVHLGCRNYKGKLENLFLHAAMLLRARCTRGLWLVIKTISIQPRFSKQAPVSKQIAALKWPRIFVLFFNAPCYPVK